MAITHILVQAQGTGAVSVPETPVVPPTAAYKFINYTGTGGNDLAVNGVGFEADAYWAYSLDGGNYHYFI